MLVRFTPARRRFLFTLGAALATSPAAWARSTTPLGGDTAKPAGSPYRMLKKPVRTDVHVVRLLFTYSCPFCRAYYPGLVRWGKSVPGPYRFVATPFLTTADDDALFLALYVRQALVDKTPASLPDYDGVMFELIQGNPESGAAPQPLTLEAALQAAAAATSTQPQDVAEYLSKTYNPKTIMAKLDPNMAAVSTYELSATPSVAVGGKVVVTPDDANGDPMQFLTLLNGLVSRDIQGQLHAT